MRIMAVDDNDQSLQSLSPVLGDLGHEVRAFSDPVEALGAATGAAYRLTITDIRRPALHGPDLSPRP
mgnify:CR=1 FL=1